MLNSFFLSRNALQKLILITSYEEKLSPLEMHPSQNTKLSLDIFCFTFFCFIYFCREKEKFDICFIKIISSFLIWENDVLYLYLNEKLSF